MYSVNWEEVKSQEMQPQPEHSMAVWETVSTVIPNTGHWVEFLVPPEEVAWVFLYKAQRQEAKEARESEAGVPLAEEATGTSGLSAVTSQPAQSLLIWWPSIHTFSCSASLLQRVKSSQDRLSPKL